MLGNLRQRAIELNQRMLPLMSTPELQKTLNTPLKNQENVTCLGKYISTKPTTLLIIKNIHVHPCSYTIYNDATGECLFQVSSTIKLFQMVQTIIDGQGFPVLTLSNGMGYGPLSMNAFIGMDLSRPLSNIKTCLALPSDTHLHYQFVNPITHTRTEIGVDGIWNPSMALAYIWMDQGCLGKQNRVPIAHWNQKDATGVIHTIEPFSIATRFYCSVGEGIDLAMITMTCIGMFSWEDRKHEKRT